MYHPITEAKLKETIDSLIKNIIDNKNSKECVMYMSSDSKIEYDYILEKEYLKLQLHQCEMTKTEKDNLLSMIESEDQENFVLAKEIIKNKIKQCQ